jgi:hypothetical protein
VSAGPDADLLLAAHGAQDRRVQTVGEVRAVGQLGRDVIQEGRIGEATGDLVQE